MLRLLIAACLVYILLPTNLEPRQLSGASGNVSTISALTAADAIARDIYGICERNREACETGKSILNATKQTVLAFIGSGSEMELSDDAKADVEISPETTGTTN
ncbi:MAG: DUF5330 domain-containing protein [Pseudomonadota bacterium]